MNAPVQVRTTLMNINAFISCKFSMGGIVTLRMFGTDGNTVTKMRCVAISACMEEQVAWESKNGGSMTPVLVPFLKEHSNPTHRELMEHRIAGLDNIVHAAHWSCRKKMPRPVYKGPRYQLCSTTRLVLMSKRRYYTF
ncbi:hypothetical protein DAEQUDRAFT_277261 [Daedalea quercina L-15889]|uniref:Uncharacterized protein n=1 Tax=Daedalea quercina L-15889 TaxID=1314783 RepID=A0A165Q7T8_9APHY|nr:hypothetical protein DAEQUDRAFT_277261 [Daedalea quercina L-15889]